MISAVFFFPRRVDLKILFKNYRAKNEDLFPILLKIPAIF